MTQTLIMYGTMIIVALLYILIWHMWDRRITQTRLEQNQKAWNEYSKGMTDNEKWDCYLFFCEGQRSKNGWQFYYFPKMLSQESEGENEKNT